MTPMRANIVGPPSAATSIRLSIAAFHRFVRFVKIDFAVRVCVAAESGGSLAVVGDGAILVAFVASEAARL
jgi:hypothetical protein